MLQDFGWRSGERLSILELTEAVACTWRLPHRQLCLNGDTEGGFQPELAVLHSAGWQARVCSKTCPAVLQAAGVTRLHH